MAKGLLHQENTAVINKHVCIKKQFVMDDVLSTFNGCMVDPKKTCPNPQNQ